MNFVKLDKDSPVFISGNDRRFQRLVWKRIGRSAACALDGGRCRLGPSERGQLFPSGVAYNQGSCSRAECGGTLPVPDRSFIVPCLTQGASAGGRFFRLAAHGGEVIRRRNHGKEYDQHTSQSQQALECAELASESHSSGAAPQPSGRERQQQPCEIQQQFHEIEMPEVPGY